MGTNYYWADKWGKEDNEDLHVHIGKRVDAGKYCWDCGTTLCLDGSRSISCNEISLRGALWVNLGGDANPAVGLASQGAISASGAYTYKPRWSDLCPCCGEDPKTLTATPDSTKGEPGLTEPENLPKEGVRPCNGFIWTLLKHRKELEKLADLAMGTDLCVVDERGRKYTAREFLYKTLRMVPRGMESQLPCKFS